MRKGLPPEDREEFQRKLWDAMVKETPDIVANIKIAEGWLKDRIITQEQRDEIVGKFMKAAMEKLGNKFLSERDN